MVGLLIETYKLDKEARLHKGAKIRHGLVGGAMILHLAACGGHPEVIRRLIDQHGLDKEAKDNNGATLLHYAAFGGHPNVIWLLINEYELDKNAKTNDGYTALHSAAFGGQPEVIRRLIHDYELDKNAKDNIGLTPSAFRCFRWPPRGDPAAD